MYIIDKWIFIFFITVIIIYNLYSLYDSYENFSVKLNNKNKRECARICRNKAGCYGFAHNKKKVCYLANAFIDNNLDKFKYSKDYTPNTIYCNKINPVLHKKDKLDLLEKRNNSIMACKTKKSKTAYLLFDKNRFLNLGEGFNYDYIFDIDDYSVS
jgi:hypothetical protein